MLPPPVVADISKQRVTLYYALRVPVPEENIRNDCEILKLNGFSPAFCVKEWKSAYSSLTMQLFPYELSYHLVSKDSLKTSCGSFL